MKIRTQLFITAILSIIVLSCSTGSKKEKSNIASIDNKSETILPESPGDADLMAFKVYHHMRYMVITAEEAGGTNKMLHTRKLPTEGTDPVVTPALDHIYTKVVVDLSEGPVTIEYPEIKDRYYSIHITDQEHYTIFDEIHPVGKYTLVRKGKGMKVPEDATVIESPGDYPHLFIRIQVKTPEDLLS